MLLSIVIPAYNASMYISACLHSIFDQVDQRVEVILVDDGSQDKTLEIILSDFGDHIGAGRLQVISQANSGPGAARNRGLDLCSGRYITFLDSDDLLLDNYYQEIVPLLEREFYDIIEHGFVRFSDSADLLSPKFKPLYSYVGPHDLTNIRSRIFARTVWYPSIRIFKSTVWQNIRFAEGVCYEDPMTIHKIFLREYSIYFTNKPYLGYRFNPKSITSLHSSSHMLDVVNLYKSLIEKCVPIYIFKVRLARSILYFHHELGAHGDIVNDIVFDIQSMPKRVDLLRHLKLIDLFFVLFTRIYISVDRLRFKFRRNPNAGQIAT